MKPQLRLMVTSLTLLLHKAEYITDTDSHVRFG